MKLLELYKNFKEKRAIKLKEYKLKQEREYKLKQEREDEEIRKYWRWYRNAKICNNCCFVTKEHKYESRSCMGDSFYTYVAYYYCMNINNTSDKLLLENEKCTCENFKQKPKELKYE